MAKQLKKAISGRALSSADIPDRLNKELIPCVNEVRSAVQGLIGGSVPIVGSRSTDTASVVGQLLIVLAAQGIVTDTTTP